MKENICRSGALMLSALMLLAGCAESSDKPSEQTSAVTETTAVTESAAAVTTQALPEEEPTEPYDPNEAVYAAAKPLDFKIAPTERDGVYALEGFRDERGAYFVDYRDGLLLASCDPSERETENFREMYDSDPPEDAVYPNAIYKVFDLNEGLELGAEKLPAKNTDEDILLYGFCSGGVYGTDGRDFVLFDLGLNELKRFELPKSGFYMLMVSEDGKTLLCTCASGASKLYDIESGSEIKMSRKVRADNMLGFEDGEFIFFNTESRLFSLGADGTVTALSEGSLWYGLWFGTEQVLYSDDMILAGRYGETARTAIHSETPKGGWRDVMYADGGLVAERLTVSKDEADLTESLVFYDTESGTKSEPLEFGNYCADLYGGDGTAFVAGEDAEYLIRFEELDFGEKADIERLTDEEEYKLHFKETVPDTDEAAELLKELREDYNVEVFFEGNKEEEYLDSYYFGPFTGDRTAVLKELKDFLELSPKELCTEASENGKSLWVLFSDDIYPYSRDDEESRDTENGSDEPGLIDPAGFASTDTTGHPLICIEIMPYIESEGEEAWGTEAEMKQAYYRGEVEYVLPHEFIHFLDTTIKNEQLEEWNKLSPKDGYIYSFGDDDYSDENEYTYYDSYDEEDIYFIYNYARTNDEEDRAVTGEYLYNAYKGGDDDYMYEDMFALEHIRKKAETLCRFFRENFDCLKQIPEGEWYLEKAL